MLTLKQVEEFCDSQDYDLRKSRNGRWIDQKCTPDIIWSIADFILDYVDNGHEEFTVRDIWQSDYAKKTVEETYSKPGTDKKSAENEYNKVFSQPVNLFCFAGIIKDVSKTKRHLYKLTNRDLLEYIAKNDMEALHFLQIYIEKVMKDSGVWSFFDNFFNEQNKIAFKILKEAIIKFYHKHTLIQHTCEPKRIFTKILNPLAHKYTKKGTIHGHLSNNIITRADLMYNRDNFRDIYSKKPKEITRKEWLEQHKEFKINTGYYKQMMNKAKKLLKNFNETYRANISELTQFRDDFDDKELALQLHHIFPKNIFPELMYYLENMIALTPNQHLAFAHPNNNTMDIDETAQKELLIAKTASIKYNLESESEKHIYDFKKLLEMLKIGWNDETVLEIMDMDFPGVLCSIEAHYN